jgi:hypothetical protein
MAANVKKSEELAKQKPARPFFRKRELTVPTWRGWLLLLLALAVLGYICFKTIHPFLAVSAPVPANFMVLEGWAPDYALKKAASEFQQNHYEKLYVTGGPIEAGAPLSEYHTYAQLGGAVLLKLGLTTNQVQEVPAPLVRQDRTYVSAVALRMWCEQHGVKPSSINLVTVGPHARRSRILFGKALGDDWKIGIIALTPESYDERRWWRYSAGVRTVTGEAFAYFYARVLFRSSRAEKEVQAAMHQ